MPAILWYRQLLLYDAQLQDTSGNSFCLASSQAYIAIFNCLAISHFKIICSWNRVKCAFCLHFTMVSICNIVAVIHSKCEELPCQHFPLHWPCPCKVHTGTHEALRLRGERVLWHVVSSSSLSFLSNIISWASLKAEKQAAQVHCLLLGSCEGKGPLTRSGNLSSDAALTCFHLPETCTRLPPIRSFSRVLLQQFPSP